jgi:hypothetical protein
LIFNSSGNLYDTTEGGGANGNVNYGTMFEVTPYNSLTLQPDRCDPSLSRHGRSLNREIWAPVRMTQTTLDSRPVELGHLLSRYQFDIHLAMLCPWSCIKMIRSSREQCTSVI